MRVLVTGGRDYLDIRRIFAGLDMLQARLPGGITEIIEGGAGGADIRARWWAERERIKVTTVEAEWTRFGRSAGPRRNEIMAQMRPDVVMICPGNDGTADMEARAKEHQLQRVYLVKMVPEFKGPMLISFLNLPQDQRPPGYGPTGERLEA